MSDKKYKGRIIKGVGGFYYVDTAEYASEGGENAVFECPARGRFRKYKQTPLVGDIVTVIADNLSKKGVVDEILPRRNVLLRPPVANVTQMAVVIAAANPRPNLYLTDKMLAAAQAARIDAVVCVNKTDIENADVICEIYKSAGYCTIPMSASDGTNVDILKEKLNGNITVFAGNSGVGKSSILNCVSGTERFETGEISSKAERGRHTTRHTELVRLDSGGYIIDTPGFGTIDFSGISPSECVSFFKEFENYTGDCRFSDCRHMNEPNCGITAAVERGDIAKSRYESYVRMLTEAESAGKR